MQNTHNSYLQSNEEVFQKIVQEKETIGYYSLPFFDTTNIKEFAKTVIQQHIVVIGIGGSSLGTYAIDNFLKHKQNGKQLHFLESTDPLDISSRLGKIDLENTLFIVISKSGTTIETVSVFKYISSLIQIDSSNCICITENDSKLNSFAQQNHIQTFEIPKNVGGRFSVFSPVGLVPLAILGVDIDLLLQGAKEVSESFFEQKNYYDLIMNQARLIAENKEKFSINVLFSYSSLLEGFNKWYVQLWGESLGKIDLNGKRTGLTPVGLLGPVDQHSFLQLIMEGVRDKTVTFIKVNDFENDMKIPDISLYSLESLDYINGITFNELINHQADATLEAVKELQDIPYDLITIDRIDELNIARLMFRFELLTSVTGAFLEINTYDQPGVELGKKKLLQKFKR